MTVAAKGTAWRRHVNSRSSDWYVGFELSDGRVNDDGWDVEVINSTGSDSGCEVEVNDGGGSDGWCDVELGVGLGVLHNGLCQIHGYGVVQVGLRDSRRLRCSGRGRTPLTRGRTTVDDGGRRKQTNVVGLRVVRVHVNN